MATATTKFPEWGWKILSILVIPVIGWGVKLEVNRAVQNTNVAALQKTVEADALRVTALEQSLVVQAERVKALQADLQEAKGMQTAIVTNTLALGKLEVKIDGVSANLGEIKTILRQP